MPILQRNTIQVNLPSFGDKHPATVKMYDGITAGDYESIDQNLKGIEATRTVLAKVIVEWNLTDKNKNPLPINSETLKDLVLSDLNFLAKNVKRDNNLDDTKKNS